MKKNSENIGYNVFWKPLSNPNYFNDVIIYSKHCHVNTLKICNINIYLILKHENSSINYTCYGS